MSNRQTFQIIGIIFFLSGYLDSFAVDLPVISEHTGLNIAHPLLKALEYPSLTVKDINQLLAGGAMDGQYFTLHISTHPLMLIDLCDCPWYKFNWDPGHHFELAKEGPKNCHSESQVFVTSYLPVTKKIR